MLLFHHKFCARELAAITHEPLVAVTLAFDARALAGAGIVRACRSNIARFSTPIVFAYACAVITAAVTATVVGTLALIASGTIPTILAHAGEVCSTCTMTRTSTIVVTAALVAILAGPIRLTDHVVAKCAFPPFTTLANGFLKSAFRWCDTASAAIAIIFAIIWMAVIAKVSRSALTLTCA